ncbi:MAG: UDP-2,3-diacylglucosamine hydrolase [Planctomycetota bacterium]|jgi:UDP-2,3-diacylglucosamine hydrolase
MSFEPLETEFSDAAGDERDLHYLVSDLHVPVGGGTVLRRLESLLTAVREGGTRARLFVLGDLFDFYVSPAQIRVDVWRRVADGLAGVVRAGVLVHVLVGNRDFLLGPEFEQVSGARLVPGGLTCSLAGHRALLVHGDELCTRDEPYQRAKRWLRHPATRFLARQLPLRAALWAARRARRQSASVIAMGDQTRFDPTAEAVDRAVGRAGAELLVFGHIHRPAAGVRGSLSYRVLPAFDEDGVHLQVRDGVLGYHRVDTNGRIEPVADFPGRTFV